jgi:tRNA threonylcarbamoyladenosine biosynthesis protein TsaE
MPTPDTLQISYSKDALPSVAETLLQWGDKLQKPVRVWAFSGGLGAGKTTLIRSLCVVLGVKDAVHSPTFSLINEYVSLGGPVLHMDWYRLRDEDEAIDAGVEDALTRHDAVCFVEWPEQAPDLLVMPHVLVEIETAGEDERILQAEARG